MFKKYYKTEHGLMHREPESAWPYNYLLENLGDCLDLNDWNEIHKQLFKLTIYLYDMDHWKTGQMWKGLFSVSPHIVVELLTEMNNYPVDDINGSVKEILNQLIAINDVEDKYRKDIRNLYDNNTFCNDLNIDLSDILDLVFGGRK